VPAPRIHEAVSDPANPVHLPYMLMDLVPGQPINLCVNATKEQLRKVMIQLAGIYQELARYPFEMIGSLDGLEEDRLGPVADQLVANLDENGNASFPGPFASAQPYYSEMISRILELIAVGELYSPWAVDTYLVHRCLLDMVPLLPGFDDQKFYLRHPDDAGFHIMVDDEFNITGIIDWKWAHTVPHAMAFSSPSWLWDVGAFFDGSNKLGAREMAFTEILGTLGCDAVSQYLVSSARNGRGMQRFSFLLGYEFYDEDFVAFTTMFGALRKILDTDPNLVWDDWRSAALKRYADDSRLQALVKRQTSLFSG
jgi:hypothetical protein